MKFKCVAIFVLPEIHAGVTEDCNINLLFKNNKAVFCKRRYEIKKLVFPEISR